MKLVINKCFGGFGVSKEALYELIKRKAKCVEKIPIDEYSGRWREAFSKECSKFMDMWGNQYGILSDKKYIYSINGTYLLRADKDLIEVVETMGVFADGFFAELKIVEVPDNIDLEWDEHDGFETVHESYSSW